MNGYKNAIKKELYAEYFGLDKYYLRCLRFVRNAFNKAEVQVLMLAFGKGMNSRCSELIRQF